MATEETIDTGIGVLNRLISGQKGEKEAGDGIPIDSTVLLRGGPGTGKTTLALQIMSRHVAEDEKNVAVFVSLEEEPMQVLGKTIAKYDFGIGFKDGNRTIGNPARQVTTVRREAIEAEILKLVGQYESGSEVEAVGEALNSVIGKEVENQRAIAPGEQATRKTLIVIDSLNGLGSVVLRAIRMKNQNMSLDLRDALWVIWSCIKMFPRRPAMLFTGEYDPENARSMSLAAESYFCDIDIQLSFEAVVRGKTSEQVSSELLKEDEWRSVLGRRKGVEKRFFCRVLKSRSGPRQLRRCAYDIVDGEGLRFYEAYPGDGQIMLFAESEPQRTEWKDFIMNDVLQMYLYPALDYSIFDRSGLQRTFTSLRHFLYIPEATDMYLSSFDTYWVNWYGELCQRLGIVEELHKMKLRCDNRDNRTEYKLFCQIVGKVHRTCTELEGLKAQRTTVLKNAVKRIVDEVCKNCKEYPNCAKTIEDVFKKAIGDSRTEVMLGENRAGLLRPIDEEDIHLFGERKSNVIKELEDRYRYGRKRLAVPYNANISFLVYREDLLQSLKGGIRANDFVAGVKSVFEDLENASQGAGHGGVSYASVQDAVEQRLVKSFEQGPEYVPETWEEIIALCDLGSELLGRKLQFLLETRTFDTFACSLLEVIWSSGQDVKVRPDYTVVGTADVRAVLFRAYYLLYKMFSEGIIPRDSCLEPEEFAVQSSTSQSEWLFARHWYSTLIDVLTAKEQRGNGDSGLVWKPDPGVRLGIMRIPVFLLYYAGEWPVKQGSAPQASGGQGAHQAKHRACWGEWYLGIMRGTENETLAVDLINNLMSSRKVCERASSGAALPTVREFYDMYGSARCFNLPERPHKLLPKETYERVREMFEDAKSRTDIFDFRHCMRELHSVLEYVRISERISASELDEKIKNAISRIEDLGKKEIFVSPLGSP